MERTQFKITIDSPREKVWNILFDYESYPEWTSVFCEGSVAETDWQKGSKVLFLDGKRSGMASRIEEKVPSEYMAFKHLGVVEDGVELYDGPKVQGWAGAMETYTLKDVGGRTELVIDMDVTEEFQEMFQDLWPKALQKVKQLAEAN